MTLVTVHLRDGRQEIVELPSGTSPDDIVSSWLHGMTCQREIHLMKFSRPRQHSWFVVLPHDVACIDSLAVMEQ